MKLKLAGAFFVTTLLLILASWMFFLTHGNGNMLANFGVHGEAFDSLAQHFLHGSIDVDPSAIQGEDSLINGHTYMYFGLFPALLRLPLLFFVPSAFGSLTRIMFLVAALLILLAIVAILNLALRNNTFLTDVQKRWVMSFSLIAVCLGTIIPYLLAEASIYVESILWGVCGSLWGIYFFLALIQGTRHQRWNVFGLSAVAAFSLLARITFGLPLYILLCVVACAALMRVLFPKSTLCEAWDPNIPLPQNVFAAAGILLLCLSPAILGGIVQLWYDFARFGDMFQAWNPPQYTVFRHVPAIFADLQKWGTMNWRRIPATVNVYFLPQGEYHAYSRHDFLIPVSPLFPMGTWENVLPFPLLSPWLLMAAVSGMLVLCSRSGDRWLRVAAVAFLFQAILILCNFYLAERYSAEMYPFFIFCSIVFLEHIRSHWVPLLALITIPLLCVSLLFNAGIGVLWTTSPKGDTFATMQTCVSSNQDWQAAWANCSLLILK